MVRVSLLTFLRGSTNPKIYMPGCANYNHHCNDCLLGHGCNVEKGQRCNYFEKAVLPCAIDTGQLERITRLNNKKIGALKVKQIKIRACPDCGAELKPRRRLCDDCRDKRNRENKRKWKTISSVKL